MHEKYYIKNNITNLFVNIDDCFVDPEDTEDAEDTSDNPDNIFCYDSLKQARYARICWLKYRYGDNIDIDYIKNNEIEQFSIFQKNNDKSYILIEENDYYFKTLRNVNETFIAFENKYHLLNSNFDNFINQIYCNTEHLLRKNSNTSYRYFIKFESGNQIKIVNQKNYLQYRIYFLIENKADLISFKLSILHNKIQLLLDLEKHEILKYPRWIMNYRK